MKRSLYIILSAALLLSASVASARLYDGGITVKDIKITPADDKMHLEMTLDVVESAVPMLQGMAVVPFISDGQFSADFPYALVNGRNRHQIFTRHKVFRYEEIMANLPAVVMKVEKGKKAIGKNAQMHYAADIHHDAWMDDGALYLRLILISPGCERQYYTLGAGGYPVTKVAVSPEPPKVVAAPPAKPAPAPAPAVRPMESVTGSAFLDFEVGKSDLLPNYKRNAQQIDKIRTLIDDIVKNRGQKVSMVITGNASPEGRADTNDELALNRAIALENYLKGIYGEQLAFSKVLSAGEDWDGLRRLVAGSSIAGRDEILRILDSNDNHDAKESRMRRVAGGAAWHTMLNDFFPQLRRVDYNIMYEMRK